MVIEYIGTIIRNEVANRKEKLYESQVSVTAAISGDGARADGRAGFSFEQKPCLELVFSSSPH